MKATTAFALAAAVLASVCTAQKDCKPTVKFPDGDYHFDLTPLYHTPEKPDKLLAYDDDYNTYEINFCGTTNDCSDNAVCQQTISGDHYGCGLLSTQSYSPLAGAKGGKGLTVKYTKGDQCSAGPARSTTLYLTCDEDVQDPIMERVVEGDCSYEVRITTKHACGKPGSGESSSSDVAAIAILCVIICLIVIYFAGGAVYQWKVKNASTPKEYIIHSEFWLALPSLVVDGCKFIAHGFKRGDYVTV